MKFKIWIKRICIFFIAFVFLFCSVFLCSQPRKTNAFPVALGASAVIAAFSAFMASSGVSITANGVSGDGLQSIWENILHDFSFENKALQDWYQGGNEVLNFIVGKENSEKIVLIGTELAIWFNEAKKWIVNSFSLDNDVDSVLSGSSGYLLEDGNILSIHSSPFTPVSISDYILYPLVSGASFSYSLANGNSFGMYVDSVNGGVTSISYYTIQNGVVSSLRNQNFGGQTGTKGIVVTTNSNTVYFNLPKLNQSTASAATLGFNMPLSFFGDLSSIGLEGSLTDGYSDFENALEDAKTQAGSGSDALIGVNVGDIAVPIPLTEEGLIDGILDGAATNSLTGELVGGYESEKEAESENDATSIPSTGDIEGDIIIVDGLEDFFPFCIPWDLYALVEKFNVPAKAPKITYSMSFANKFNDEDIILDFSQWESAARIFRVLIVIGFGVFLILKTRSLIRG